MEYMEREQQNKESFQQAQQGSGSAEQTDRSRTEQQQQAAQLSEDERQDIAGALGRDAGRMASLKDLGALSGRDDAAGGSGDRMTDESTDAPTDR